MIRAWTFTAALLSAALVPLGSLAAEGPIRIPQAGEGYDIKRTNESNRKAPPGFEGRTETSTLTAVGITPATKGKRIVARFMLSNEIRTCPMADGTAEGRGVMSMSLDYTDNQASGTSSFHIEMKVAGTYKGQVGDDAWITNPVNADIDYSYSQRGSLRDPSGALATPSLSNVAQRVTIPINVGRGMTAPDIGAFSGGDPTQGRYVEAVLSGMALVYWAGLYYSEAQTKWRQPGTCVEVEFKPPSYTVRLVPGGRTTVEAQVTTKAGAIVDAQFHDARARSGIGTVSPAAGRSPMQFTFTAPSQRVASASFTVMATSRAGIGSGEWFAGLGTDWSGSISFSYATADSGGNELQTWSNSSATRMTIVVKNGTGTATGYAEIHEMGVHRQWALQGGSKSLITASTNTTDGTLEDSSPATVEVLNPTPGTYVISVSVQFKEGRAQSQSCSRNNPCMHTEQQLVVVPLPSIDGRVDDPNRLSGTKTDVRRGGGFRGDGTVTSTVTWNLAREGTGR